MTLGDTNSPRELNLRYVETTEFADSPANCTQVELNATFRFSFALKFLPSEHKHQFLTGLRAEIA